MRRKLVAIAVMIVIAIAVDARRTPADQWSGRAAVAGIHAYQATLSPLYSRMGLDCRFTTTCSRYGEVAIRKYGFARGSWMSMKRIARCGPWTPDGTVDEP